MDKASTDGGEQLPSSPTGGLPTLQQAPHSAANHPNPAAEATDAAGPIIRDYGITN